MDRWKKALVNEQCTIGDVISNLDQSKVQISLVIDSKGKLLGTITDGDVRRGLLNGHTLASPARLIWKKNAMVVPQHLEREIVMQMMRANKILQMPVVDEQGKVVNLHIWDQLEEPVATRGNVLVIMAGGRGTRMLPHTENCPKPMLPIKGKPILEHIIVKAKREGIEHIVVSTHYLGHMIEDYFQDGKKWEVQISYVREDSPLGTAGALSLIPERPKSPFIITNGDVLTKVSYVSILDFHIARSSFATMAVRNYEMTNPFGVVKVDGVNIVGFEEKPVIRSNVNAGVYILEPNALDHVEKNKFLDMPSLFEKLRLNKKNVMAYPIHEDWMDVGKANDLEKANAE
jgi:dTDP-glucose pyrophosphorylase